MGDDSEDGMETYFSIMQQNESSKHGNGSGGEKPDVTSQLVIPASFCVDSVSDKLIACHKVVKYYRVFRLMEQDDYFRANFDHF